MSRQRIQTPTNWLMRLRKEDRNAADAFEAMFRALVGRPGDGRGTGDRFDDVDLAEDRAGVSAITVGRPLVWDGGSGRQIESDPSQPATIWRAGGFMHVEGCLFGGGFAVGDGLYTWIGPNIADLDQCTVDNAFYYLASISGSLVEGGTGGAGGGTPGLNYSNTDPNAMVGDTATITHGPGGTSLGNTITVTISLRIVRRKVISDGSGSPFPTGFSADLILTRDKAGGGAVSVATPTATVTSVVFTPSGGELANGIATETIDFTQSYTDPDTDTDERVFVLELDDLDNEGSGWTTLESILTVASNEPA